MNDRMFIINLVILGFLGVWVFILIRGLIKEEKKRIQR